MVCPKTKSPSSFDFPLSLKWMANKVLFRVIQWNSFPVRIRFKKVKFSFLVNEKEDFYLLPYPVSNFIKYDYFETICHIKVNINASCTIHWLAWFVFINSLIRFINPESKYIYFTMHITWCTTYSMHSQLQRKGPSIICIEFWIISTTSIKLKYVQWNFTDAVSIYVSFYIWKVIANAFIVCW